MLQSILVHHFSPAHSAMMKKGFVRTKSFIPTSSTFLFLQYARANTETIRSDFCIPTDFGRLCIHEGQLRHLGGFSSIREDESTLGNLLPSLQQVLLISSVSEACRKRILLLFYTLGMFLA